MDANYSIAHRSFFNIDDNKNLIVIRRKREATTAFIDLSVTKGRVGKMWVPSGRKWEPCLSNTWRKLMTQ